MLAKLSPDVEALLINRMNGAREYFWVPIDECYRLTGLVRKHWRGFSGGEEGWEQIERFFDSAEGTRHRRLCHADLSFEIVAANPVRDMITPALAFDLRVTNAFPEQSIQAVLLRCQIQIEVARRRYSAAEQDQLRDLFDDPSRWGDTLRPMTWANISVNIPAFSGSTVYPITVPCTFDFNVATAKYFHGIADGEVPLTFLFSGTVFYDAGQGTPAGRADLLE